jgi:radical SAM protein
MGNADSVLARARTSFDFDDHPLLAIWEVTQACDLVCQHCRACATPRRNPAELDTREGKKLLDQIADMGTRLMVLTGGDPTKRPDLVELVRHGTQRGMTMALTPSGTGLMTAEVLEQLRDAGLSRVAVSVDGPDAPTHDRFRGVPGSFDHSMRILEEARTFGLERQINFTLSRLSLDKLDAMSTLAGEVGVSLLSVFVVIPTGRATEHLTLEANEVEVALERLASISRTVPFQVKTTGAPQFRRVLLQLHAKRGSVLGVHQNIAPDGQIRSTRGINDGNGFVFVSHVGDVFPSGFLLIRAGNVRLQSLSSIYRSSKLFLRLRDTTLVEGKCGACSFKQACGGSRARAYAMTGNELAADPACAYVPPSWTALAATSAA